MQKKIIAIACVMILAITVFVSCGKKVPMITLEEGVSYPLATDAEGNTVVNENGYIGVYVTEDNGDYATDSNGENKINWVTFPDSVVEGQKYENVYYSVTLPEGWDVDKDRHLAVSSDETMYVELNMMSDEDTLEDYYNNALENSYTLDEELKNNGYETRLETGETTIGADGLTAYYITYDLKPSEETETAAETETETASEATPLDFSSIQIYFEYEGRIFKAFYRSDNADGYSLDQVREMFSSLTMKHYIEEETE